MRVKDTICSESENDVSICIYKFMLPMMFQVSIWLTKIIIDETIKSRLNYLFLFFFADYFLFPSAIILQQFDWLSNKMIENELSILFYEFVFCIKIKGKEIFLLLYLHRLELMKFCFKWGFMVWFWVQFFFYK